MLSPEESSYLRFGIVRLLCAIPETIIQVILITGQAIDHVFIANAPAALLTILAVTIATSYITRFILRIIGVISMTNAQYATEWKNMCDREWWFIAYVPGFTIYCGLWIIAKMILIAIVRIFGFRTFRTKDYYLFVGEQWYSNTWTGLTKHIL